MVRKTERHQVIAGLWIELPAGLKRKEVKARIKSFLGKLNQKHYVYNPKGK